MNRYWIGNGGNYSDTAHWSTTSGGTGGASVPTSSDSIYFDANSFTTTSQTVTVDIDGLACNDCIWTNVTNSPTLLLNYNLSTYWDVYMPSAMTVNGTGYFIFRGSNNRSISIKTTNFNVSVTFAEPTPTTTAFTGQATLQWNWVTTGAYILFQSGTLLLNGFNLTTNRFTMNGSTATRSLNLGSGTVSCANLFEINGSNYTFNASNSTLLITDPFGELKGGSNTFYNVNFNNVFINNIYGTNTYTNLTLGVAAYYRSSKVYLYANQTVTGTFSVTGYGYEGRIDVRTDGQTTERTITANAVSLTDVNFRNIIQAGAAAPFTGTRIGYIYSLYGSLRDEWTNPQYTHYLWDGYWANAGTAATSNEENFNHFHVPLFTGYGIDGIEVYLRGRDVSGVSTTWTVACKLSSDGGATYSDTKTQTYSTSDELGEEKTFGGTTDVWGRSWSAPDLNSSNFLAMFTVTNGQSAKNFWIDQIFIRVYTSAGTTTSTSLSTTSSSISTSTSISTTSSSISTTTTSSSSTSRTDTTSSSCSSSISTTSSSISTTSSSISISTTSSSSSSITTTSSSVSTTSSSISTTSISTTTTSVTVFYTPNMDIADKEEISIDADMV